jgi:hypothetical protein
MKDRTSVVVWADGYMEVGDDLVFGALVDATADEQADLDATNRTPSNPLRVAITIARFPRSAVEMIR